MKKLFLLCFLTILTILSIVCTIIPSEVLAASPLSKTEIQETEQLLSNLGYWTGPVDGKWDDGSRHALIAFQKVTGRKRTGKLTTEELEAIQAAKPPLPYEGGDTHVEIDLHRQVLFIVNNGSVSHILPISTGNNKFFTEGGRTRRAHTPEGRFKVYAKINGWRKSPLGLLYYPCYIHKGIAIHGNPSVPAYPASHGCIRIPMHAAKQFSEMIPIGMEVIIHSGLIATTSQ
ncbi:MAG: L,D-transpeptidase family protein [Acidobacteriota bacterium]